MRLPSLARGRGRDFIRAQSNSVGPGKPESNWSVFEISFFKI
jgi:hypothetical protein